METICFIIGVVYITIAVMLAMSIKIVRCKPSTDRRVSLIIPARNEGKDLHRSLKSVEKLDYPIEKLQIVLVNHNSADDTLAQMQEFKERSRFETIIVDLKSYDPETSCKAEALRAGIEKATGEVLAFTDAEARFAPGWLKSLAGNLKNGFDMAGGSVYLEKDGLFANLQSADWTLLCAAGSGLTESGNPESLFGKNMILTKSLYNKSGGFPEGKLWTEDLSLVQKCKKYGKITLNMSPDCAVESLPAPDITSFFQQKLRWLKGGVSADVPGMTVMVSSVIMDLSLVISLFTSVEIFLMLYFFKLISDYILLNKLSEFYFENNLWRILPLYSLFASFYHTVILIRMPFTYELMWR